MVSSFFVAKQKLLRLQHIQWGSRSLTAQILVTTLLVLMVISLTVVTVTVTVARNSKQVSTNLQYKSAYNYAEDKIIRNSSVISSIDLTSPSIAANLGADVCISQPSNPPENVVSVLCKWTEVDGLNTRETILTIADSQNVTSYELEANEYFDIALTKSASSGFYNGEIDLSWTGKAALELTLVYEATFGGTRELYNASDIYANSADGILTAGSAGSAYQQLFAGGLTRGADGILRVNLAQSNVKLFRSNNTAIDHVAAAVKYKYLRVKMLSRDPGTSVTITPVAVSADYPSQVRKVSAVSYLSGADGTNVPAPSVISQFPLSPTVVGPINSVLGLDALRMPLCTNAILESREKCDDGNTANTDTCNDRCTFTSCGDSVTQSPNGEGDTEQCDDGNAVNTDTCTNKCKLTSCGDGVTQSPNGYGEGEICDDGNAFNTDTCNSSCLKTRCGDNLIQAPNGDGVTETCDDGDSDDTNACRNDCTVTPPPPPTPPTPPPGCRQGRRCCASSNGTKGGLAIDDCTGVCSGNAGFPNNDNCNEGRFIVSSSCCEP